MRPGKQSRYIQMWPRCRDCEHGACGVVVPLPPPPLLVLVLSMHLHSTTDGGSGRR